MTSMVLPRNRFCRVVKTSFAERYLVPLRKGHSFLSFLFLKKYVFWDICGFFLLDWAGGCGPVERFHKVFVILWSHPTVLFLASSICWYKMLLFHGSFVGGYVFPLSYLLLFLSIAWSCTTLGTR